MKLSSFLFPAFIASALASPVQQRETSSLSSILSTLQTSVLAHDASLNKTAASLTASSTKEEKAAAVASSESDLKAITASMQTATSSMRSLSADEKSGDTAAETQMVNNIYSDIKNTISNMNKDTLASTSPQVATNLVSGMADMTNVLGALLTGVVNLVVNVLQLVVGVLVATIPGALNLGSLLEGLPGNA